MFTPVIRPNLLQLINRCRTVPLTLLIAPAGSGKSVLLNQWQESQFDSHIIRLNLEVRDKNPAVFFRRFLESLPPQTADSPRLNPQILSEHHAASLSSLSDSLLRILESIDEELIIILDDFHYSNSPAACHVISSMVDQLPNNIHLIISTRHYPEFSLSRLHFDESLHVISANDLTIGETTLNQIVTDTGMPSLPKDVTKKILSHTEGWAVGVRMTLGAYQKYGEHFLDNITQNAPEMMDYFGYVILDEFPTNLQHLLIRNAILERFDSSLWGDVLFHDNTADQEYFTDQTTYNLFESTVSQGLFIVPCPEDPGYFRYNGLLRAFLLKRLASILDEKEIRSLHKLAANAWLNRNHIEYAIEHAKSTLDTEFYLSLLSSSCKQWLNEGHASKAFSYLSDLTDAQVFSNQSLLESMVFSLVLSRRFHQAQYYLDILTDTPSPSTLSTMLSPFLEFLALCLRFFSGDTNDDIIQHFHQQAAKSKHPNIRASALVIIAYHQLQQGSFEQAVATAAQAKARLSHAGLTYYSSYADLIIALCDRNMGRGITAADNLKAIYHTIRDNEDSPHWVNISTGIAVTHYEQNQLDAALEMCERLLPKIGQACATEIVATIYLLLSRLLHIEKHNKNAAKLLATLDRILILGHYPRYRSQTAQESMRQSLVDNNPDSALRIAHTYNLLELYEQGYWSNITSYSESKERYGIALSYLFQLQGKLEHADALLSTLHRVASTHKVRARALISQCNRIVIEYKKGHCQRAANHLKREIASHGLTFFCRSVFDEAPALHQVFAYANSTNVYTPPHIFTAVFNDTFDAPTDTIDAQHLLNQLTKKEHQIYALLVSGLSNLEISSELDIALSTTKWHLKNIYSKLGVANRTSAIVISRKAV